MTIETPPLSKKPPSVFAQLAVPGVVFLLGLGLFCYAGWAYVRERAFLARAVHTEGKVVKLLHWTYKGRDRWRPTYSFTDASGQLRTFQDAEAHYSRDPIGKTVGVFYESERPADAQVETGNMAIAEIIMPGLCGIVPFALGLFALQGNLRKIVRKQKDETPRDPAILSGL